MKNKNGAIFHFDCKVHSRSSGANAVKLAAYRAGQRLKCELTGRIFNYRRKKEVEYRQIFGPKHAEDWVFNREILWNTVNTVEQRKDSQLAREVEVALPLALTRKQQYKLIRSWVRKTFVREGMVADVCLHAKKGNPHVHILLSMRALEIDTFGKKMRSWNDPQLVQRWRESWAKAVNTALRKAGLDLRIDHRSYKEQGIKKIPTRHIGRDNGSNSKRVARKREENQTIEMFNISGTSLNELTSLGLSMQANGCNASSPPPSNRKSSERRVRSRERRNPTGDGIYPGTDSLTR